MQPPRYTILIITSAMLAPHPLIATTGPESVEPFDELLQRIQNDPFGTFREQEEFVANSLQYVEEGADRGEVVDALASIAIMPFSSSGGAAVAALAYIGDERQRQEALLRVITGDGSDVSFRREAAQAAARYLKLEADESILTKLLEFVRARWGSQEADIAGSVLYHHGDPRYFQLLEERIKEGDWENETDPTVITRKQGLEYQLRQMRLAQRPLSEILDAISSADLGVDRQYLVQQGARQGADPEPYRAAVVKYLSLPKKLTKRAWKDPLIEVCHRLGLFTTQDAKKFPLPVRGSISGSTNIVPWAAGYEERWLEIHQFGKKAAAEK